MFFQCPGCKGRIDGYKPDPKSATPAPMKAIVAVHEDCGTPVYFRPPEIRVATDGDLALESPALRVSIASQMLDHMAAGRP